MCLRPNLAVNRTLAAALVLANVSSAPVTLLSKDFPFASGFAVVR
jgi:hypothetical protein